MSLEQALKRLKHAKEGSSPTVSSLPLSLQPKLQTKMLTAMLLNWNAIHGYSNYWLNAVMLPFLEIPHKAERFPTGRAVYYPKPLFQRVWNPLLTACYHHRGRAVHVTAATLPFKFQYCMICNAVHKLETDKSSWDCLLSSCSVCLMPPCPELSAAATDVNLILLSKEAMVAEANDQLRWLWEKNND